MLDLASELGSAALSISKGPDFNDIDPAVFRSVLDGYVAGGGSAAAAGSEMVRVHDRRMAGVHASERPPLHCRCGGAERSRSHHVPRRGGQRIARPTGHFRATLRTRGPARSTVTAWQPPEILGGPSEVAFGGGDQRFCALSVGVGGGAGVHRTVGTGATAPTAVWGLLWLSGRSQCSLALGRAAATCSASLASHGSPGTSLSPEHRGWPSRAAHDLSVPRCPDTRRRPYRGERRGG